MQSHLRIPFFTSLEITVTSPLLKVASRPVFVTTQDYVESPQGILFSRESLSLSRMESHSVIDRKTICCSLCAAASWAISGEWLVLAVRSLLALLDNKVRRGLKRGAGRSS